MPPSENQEATSAAAPAASDSSAMEQPSSQTHGSPRTVAIFCFEDPRTPVGLFAADAARALSGRGHGIALFTRDSFGIARDGVTEHVITGIDGNEDLIGQVRAFTLNASALFQASLGLDADCVLLGCEWTAVPVLQIVSALRKRPSMLVLHTLERQRSDMSSALSKQIEAFEIQGIEEAGIVFTRDVHTTEMARRLAADYANKIQTLVPVFDPAPFRRELDAGEVKARYQIGPVDPTVLFCGVLDEDHGPDLLIKAVPAILKKHKQVRFVFVGEGPLFWMLRIYCRYLNLDYSVRIAGHLAGEALNDLIQASDLIIAPSRKPTEDWPILAGWAAGKAVVASHESAGKLITHEQNGVLIYPLADSCIWGVSRVLEDSNLWGRIVENGRATLKSTHGFDVLANQIATAVQNL